MTDGQKPTGGYTELGRIGDDFIIGTDKGTVGIVSKALLDEWGIKLAADARITVLPADYAQDEYFMPVLGDDVVRVLFSEVPMHYERIPLVPYAAYGMRFRAGYSQAFKFWLIQWRTTE